MQSLPVPLWKNETGKGKRVCQRRRLRSAGAQTAGEQTKALTSRTIILYRFITRPSQSMQPSHSGGSIARERSILELNVNPLSLSLSLLDRPGFGHYYRSKVNQIQCCGINCRIRQSPNLEVKWLLPSLFPDKPPERTTVFGFLITGAL